MLYDCNHARFDNARPLSDEELFRAAPSIFAEAPHESRSDKFLPIPTIQVVNALRKEGFLPVAARQSGTRDETRIGFTKHLIRLRRTDEAADYKVGDTVCEVILRNANDGTASYELMAGLFRIKCLNSLVAQTGTVDSVKVKHLGRDVPGQVIEGTYRVMGEAQKALAAPVDWGRTQLPEEARQALAKAAHTLRFEGTEAPVEPKALLSARRYGDDAHDLWTSFNTVQENCIRGGLRGWRRDENRHLRRATTRAVNGIDQDVKLNKALWLVGEELFKTLKRAA